MGSKAAQPKALQGIETLNVVIVYILEIEVWCSLVLLAGTQTFLSTAWTICGLCIYQATRGQKFAWEARDRLLGMVSP